MYKSKAKENEKESWIFRDMHWLLALCIVLPVLFLIFLELTRGLYLEQIMSRTTERITISLVMFVGVLIFSNIVFLIIRQLREASEKQRRQLHALNEVGFELAAEHQLEDILQTVVSRATNTLEACYGALIITSKNDTSKNADSQETSILNFVECDAQGKIHVNDTHTIVNGILNSILNDGRTIIVDDLQNHTQFNEASGLPQEMTSLMGVPIVSKTRIIGGLYLCNGKNRNKFTYKDLSVLSLLAAHSAVAVDNAHLYERLGKLSVLEERQRIAMDLHDGAIQSLYALGLQLESLTDQAQNAGSKLGHIEVDGASDKIGHAVSNINGVIKELREYIFQLNLEATQPGTITSVLHEEAVRLRAHGINNIEVDICQQLTKQQDQKLYNIERIIHESVSNVIRHSKASSVHLSVNCESEDFCFIIEDNGVGGNIEDIDKKEGQGLKNIRKRLARLDGKLKLNSVIGSGFCAKLIIPINKVVNSENL